MAFLDSVQGVLTIILMIGVGYFLSARGWLDDNASKLMAKLVPNVALPAYMISNLLTTYDREKLIHLKSGLFVPFVTMVACYGLAMLLSNILRLPENRRGVFCTMFALSNTIFVGLPVNLALFGEQSVPYVLLCYIANTTLFWTIGVYGIGRYGGAIKSKLISIESLKRIFSPPLVSFMFAIVLILLRVTLPKSIMDTCKYMGNLTTPLSMLFIGYVMYTVKLSKIKMDRGMAVIMLGRFLIVPGIVIFLCLQMNMPILMKKVFVIQAAMPAMTQTAIIAEIYGADYKYAAVVTTATTIASLVVIPIYMVFIGKIF